MSLRRSLLGACIAALTIAAPAQAEIINTTVRGPAIIGKGSRIVNSYVGPFTSIHHGVEIRNSELEHSIVLENSKILDVSVRIEDSLIGKDVVVRRTTKMPKALRFMLYQAGFRRVETVTPPPGAYEQHARGKRVVCAAWK